MARGKYATRSEAAKARETALEEAARLRRDVARLTEENEALQGALNDTLGTMHSESSRLRAIALQADPEEVAEYKAERDEAVFAAVNANLEVARAIIPILRRDDVVMSMAAQAALTDALGVSADEVYQWDAPNRRRRRTTPKKMRQRAEVLEWAIARGAPLT